MKVCKLHRMKDQNVWLWRTVEGNKGDYFTYANGKGILFYSDKTRRKEKLATFERFQACKTVSGTRRKLNRFFADMTDDPFE